MAGLAADLLILAHLGFVVFVVLGGILVWRWPRMAWLHLPAAAWGAVVEFTGWICPLTPWEQRLRQAAGESGYPGGFIAHYLTPVLYPAGLTPAVQYGLGALVLAINALIYLAWFRRRKHGQPRP